MWKVYNKHGAGAFAYYLGGMKLSRFQKQDNIETLLR